MFSLSSGLVTAVIGVFLGLIVELSLQGLVSAGVLDSVGVLAYQLLNLLVIFILVHLTSFWGILYLLGWWSGSGMMTASSVLGGLEFGLYSVILALVMLSKIRKRLG
jgi:hypothetical protein